MVNRGDQLAERAERAAGVVQIGRNMRHIGGRLEGLGRHARDITGRYHASMEVSRGEWVGALFALVLLVGLLVIDVDVLTRGRLLGGRGGPVGLEDQAVSEGDGGSTSGD